METIAGLLSEFPITLNETSVWIRWLKGGLGIPVRDQRFPQWKKGKNDKKHDWFMSSIQLHTDLSSIDSIYSKW